MNASPSLPASASASRHVRFRGWMLVLIGPGLCVTMAFCALYLAQSLPGNPLHLATSGARWHGSHEMTVLAFGIFGAVFLFGLLSLAGGVSLLARGRVGPVLGVLLGLVVLTTIYLGYRIITTPTPA